MNVFPCSLSIHRPVADTDRNNDRQVMPVLDRVVHIVYGGRGKCFLILPVFLGVAFCRSYLKFFLSFCGWHFPYPLHVVTSLKESVKTRGQVILNSSFGCGIEKNLSPGMRSGPAIIVFLQKQNWNNAD